MPFFKILYTDESLMVLDKAPGVVVAPSETQTGQTIAQVLQTDYGITLDRGGIVHRLDKDTSGLLLIAKTQEALTELQRQFKQREVSKCYLALVHGLTDKTGKIEGPIGRNPGNREKFIITPDGKPAITMYETIGSFQLSPENFNLIFHDLNKIQTRKLVKSQYGQFSLLRCFPQTGRTHQIRVHLKSINHPIVGDSKYGGRKTARLDARWCPRQFLHAEKIEFIHPWSHQKTSFTSPLPQDLAQALTHLGLINSLK